MRLRPWFVYVFVVLSVMSCRVHTPLVRAGGAPPTAPTSAFAATCPPEQVHNNALGVSLPLPAGWQESTPNAAPPSTIFLYVPGYEGSPRLLIASLGATADPDPVHAVSAAADRLVHGLTLPITRTSIVVAGVPGVMLYGLPGQTTNVQVVLVHAGGVYNIIIFGAATLTLAGRALLDSIAFIPRTASFPLASSSTTTLSGPFPSLLALNVGTAPNRSGVRIMAMGHGYRPSRAVAVHVCWQGVLRPGLGAAPTSYVLDGTARTDGRGLLTLALTVPVASAAYGSYRVHLTVHDARIGNLLKIEDAFVGSGTSGVGLASCPAIYSDVPNPNPNPNTGVAIDWIDFVRHDGVDYAAPMLPRGRDLTPGDLGPQAATVCFQVSDHVEDPAYHLKDGDAAFLAPGTPLYAVEGYKTSFRLAAYFGGRIVLFESDANPRARTGADLLDIAFKVRSIEVRADDNGLTTLGVVSDPGQVATLVRLVLAAPLSKGRTNENGPRYFITFRLNDGTQVTRAYFRGTGELVPGIITPPAFRAAVERTAHRYVR